MRKLTDVEIQQINGSGSTTHNLPFGTTVTTTLMPNKSTTIAGQLGNGWRASVNSGQQFSRIFISAGVSAMVLPFVGPAGAFVAGLAASFGAGKLMGGVNSGA